MAKSKPKSTKKGKSKASSKSKTTVEAVEAKKTAVVEEKIAKDETVVVEKKAKKNAKKDNKKSEKSTKKSAEKVSEKTAEVKVVTVKKENAFKRFFEKKGDKNENILTIFKNSKIFGAILAEMIGTGILATLALTLGFGNPLYLIFIYLAANLLIFKLSGANMNPLITAGMMASRRISAMRGVLYIIAQILGAWAAYMILSGFLGAGEAINIAAGADELTAASATMPMLDALSFEDGASFWAFTMLEFAGAIVMAFGFARALRHKNNHVEFALTATAAAYTAYLFAVIISQQFLSATGNAFVLNPAVAFVYGLFPAEAEGFDALMEALVPMVVAYIIFPILGGIVGTWISDIVSMLSHEKLVEENEE